MKEKVGLGSGKIFVISAPSGSGKTTLCKRLLSDDLGLVNSVSVTTRPPRKNEVNGRDYYFVSEADFEKMAERKEFLEYENNFGYFYGTPNLPVERTVKKGRSILLSIDVKGAMRVKKSYPKTSVLIFILPPSIKDLKKRLFFRKSDGEKEIAKRLDLARKEMLYKDKYDYKIVNDSLGAAYKKLKKIIISEDADARYAYR